MKQFETIDQAIEFINEFASSTNFNNFEELTINDVICFGVNGVYAYTNEACKAGLVGPEYNKAFTSNLTDNELTIMLEWLLNEDGYLIAA